LRREGPRAAPRRWTATAWGSIEQGSYIGERYKPAMHQIESAPLVPAVVEPAGSTQPDCLVPDSKKGSPISDRPRPARQTRLGISVHTAKFHRVRRVPRLAPLRRMPEALPQRLGCCWPGMPLTALPPRHGEPVVKTVGRAEPVISGAAPNTGSSLCTALSQRVFESCRCGADSLEPPSPAVPAATEKN
jgi:hypothetical protein